MPTLESERVVGKTKAFVDFALYKLEDVQNFEVVLLSGATSLSEAFKLMGSVDDMLRKTQGLLVHPASNLKFEDDSSVQEWMATVVDVCICSERVIVNFLKDAERGIENPPESVKRISSKPVNLFLLHRLGIEMNKSRYDRD